MKQRLFNMSYWTGVGALLIMWMFAVLAGYDMAVLWVVLAATCFLWTVIRLLFWFMMNHAVGWQAVSNPTGKEKDSAKRPYTFYSHSSAASVANPFSFMGGRNINREKMPDEKELGKEIGRIGKNVSVYALISCAVCAGLYLLMAANTIGYLSSTYGNFTYALILSIAAAAGFALSAQRVRGGSVVFYEKMIVILDSQGNVRKVLPASDINYITSLGNGKSCEIFFAENSESVLLRKAEYTELERLYEYCDERGISRQSKGSNKA